MCLQRGGQSQSKEDENTLLAGSPRLAGFKSSPSCHHLTTWPPGQWGAVQPYSAVFFYWPSSAWWKAVGHHLVKVKWGSKAPKFYKGKKEGC